MIIKFHALQRGINVLSYINLMEYYTAVKMDDMAINLLMWKGGRAWSFRFFQSKPLNSIRRDSHFEKHRDALIFS